MSEPTSSSVPRGPGRPPGFRGTPNRQIRYECSNCGLEKERTDLTVKRVAFHKIGKSGKQIRSRTIAWLCRPCLDADPHWTMDARIEAPGMKDVRDAGS